MRILILGGTGAIGEELVPILASDKENQLVVTSRRKLNSCENISYVQGNAMDMNFVISLLENACFDVIVDFMLYSVNQFKERYELFLKSCKQYLFFSSARVYAASDTPIKESSRRLLDVTEDLDFLQDGEYSLTKAMEEDILQSSTFNNWVIIRPYKTYSNGRLQLGVFEKEQWLYRATAGKGVLAAGNIKNLHTSLTSSKDTAKVLNRIVGDLTINGDIIQIANPEKITWGQVVQIYSDCVEVHCGKKLDVFYAEDTTNIEVIFKNKYRIKYDGLIDRIFDDSKVKALMGSDFSWTPVSIGLTDCTNAALERYEHDKNRKCAVYDYRVEGFYDRMVGRHMPLSTIPGIKNRMKYMLWLSFDAAMIQKVKKLIKAVASPFNYK